MKQVTIWLVLTTLAVTVNSKHLISVNPDVNVTVTNEGYPLGNNKPDHWLFTNHQHEGRILIRCLVRFKGNKVDCDKSKLTIYDGGNTYIYCANRTDFRLQSRYNSIDVRTILTENSDAAFRCDASAFTIPKTLKHIYHEIKLRKYVKNYDVVGNLTTDMNYRYSYKCDGECRIGLRCNIQVSISDNYESVCGAFKLLLISATDWGNQCMSKKYFTFLSTGNELTVSVTTGPHEVKGIIDCEIMAIDNIKHSKYKEIGADPRYDSSELGSKDIVGKKKSTCECGWTNKQNKRIIFGKDTGEHEFPWSVSLQLKNIKFHFCGGSIITTRHILTADHCIGIKKPQDIIVVMGTNKRTDSTITSGVKEIIRHNYNKANHEHDIAIVVVDTKIEFTETVGPVCLPTVNHTELVNQHVTAMGWGALHETEKHRQDDRIQKKTTLRVVDIDSCTLDWNYHWDIKAAKVICTWGGISDICLGDSGGPVVWHDPELHRFALVGMPALCDGCTLRLPSVHTNVHYHFDWIHQMIAKSTEPNEQTCYKI